VSLARTRRRAPACGLALVILSLSGAAQAGVVCAAPWLALGAGAQGSRWKETSAQGQTLVKENGTLYGPAVTIGTLCGGFEWVLLVARASGDRDYEGVTSANAPLRTQSAIKQQVVELQGFVPLDANWSGAGRVGLRWVDREIASVARVQGYREQFFSASLDVGLRFAWLQSAPVRWGVSAWLGAGPPGRVDLQLPRADAAELRLGASRSAAFELQAQGESLEPGWHWQARLGYRQERWSAGPAQVIYRQGVPVAGAAQPATRQSALELNAGLWFDF
jgi:hypothetical protein